MSKNINESKLIDGKRKNGHKLDCSCQICENMKNKANTGGYQEEEEKAKENMMGGSKKKNGHRKACKCPICKNMKNSKKRGGSKSTRKTKKRTGGNHDDEKEEINDDTDSSDEEDHEDHEEHEEHEQHEEEDMTGGRKKKRGNGHKANCQYPICKNMRKKKGGQQNQSDQEPDTNNQIGELDIKSTTGSDVKNNESTASTSDYDQLDAAERGEAVPNVGGTRKKHRSGKKYGGKTRKSKKSRRSRR